MISINPELANLLFLEKRAAVEKKLVFEKELLLWQTLYLELKKTRSFTMSKIGDLQNKIDDETETIGWVDEIVNELGWCVTCCGKKNIEDQQVKGFLLHCRDCKGKGVVTE